MKASTKRNDPLVAIAAMVPFEYFRPKLKAALFLPGVNLVRRNFLARRQASDRRLRPI
jgi:hypothetical protein